MRKLSIDVEYIPSIQRHVSLWGRPHGSQFPVLDASEFAQDRLDSGPERKTQYGIRGNGKSARSKFLAVVELSLLVRLSAAAANSHSSLLLILVQFDCRLTNR